MLQTILYGVLVVGGVCLLALGGFELVHRLVPAAAREKNNEVAGFIYAALGVIYAVLLALVVIAVWEEYGAANTTVEREANAAGDIYWLANQLPEETGAHVQELVRSYAEEVVQKEWPLMQEGRTPLMAPDDGGTPAGWNIIDSIRDALQGFEASTMSGQELYAEALDQIDALSDARRMRLVASQEGVPGILWSVLIVGAIAAIGFTYLFGLASTWAHRLMVLTLSAVIGLVLFTVGAMEYPFSGDARISPEAFELILERFDTSKLSKQP